jgi:alanyl-tRNA synthetase
VSTTDRLYYSDSHLVEFDASVLEAAESAPGRVGLVLDRTAFYPTGGGQPHDTGAIGRARVVDCFEQTDGRVVHVVEGAKVDVPREGERVRGRVDWPRRLDHIQQHTGQHILSQSLLKLYGAPTRSFRMTERACEIDVELPEPSDERVEAAVDLANRIVWEDRPLRALNVTAEEAKQLPLRRDSAREGELRLVEIEGFDLSPCGGTHAARTGEVGGVVVRSWERAKGMTRIEFAAGNRAVADYRLANASARRTAALFSAARDDAPALAARLVEENKQLARRLRSLEGLAARAEAEELARSAEPLGGTARLVARALEDRDAEALKLVAHAIISRPGHVALLGAREGDEARLVFARSPEAPGDMNQLLRAACATLEGRGGGRPDLAQGGGRRADKLTEAIETAARTLREQTAPS